MQRHSRFFVLMQQDVGADWAHIIERLQNELRERLADYTPARFSKPGATSNGVCAPWEKPPAPGMPPETVLTQFENPFFGDKQMALELSVDKHENLFANCLLCYSKHNTSVKSRGPKRQKLDSMKFSDSLLLNICTHSCTKAHQGNLLSYYKGARDALRLVSICTVQASPVSDTDEHGLDRLYEMLAATCKVREQSMLDSYEGKGGEAWRCDEVMRCGAVTPNTKEKLTSHRLPTGSGLYTGRKATIHPVTDSKNDSNDKA
jgi:hypothetical protein